MLSSVAMRVLFTASAVAIMLATKSGGQNPPTQPPPSQTASKSAPSVNKLYRYRLLGVYDEATGTPIEGVEVRDETSGKTSPTDKTGLVSLSEFPPGATVLTLRKIGYDELTYAIRISPADTASVTLTMRRVARALEAVTVIDSAPRHQSSRLQRAEARLRSHSGGYFIDEAEMRKLDNSSMADALIQKAVGLMSILGPHGETFFASTRHPCAHALIGCTKVNCYIRVYLDGILTTVHPDFNNVWARDYAIAEFYPGGASVPAEFGGSDATCGVLLLWSRER